MKKKAAKKAPESSAQTAISGELIEFREEFGLTKQEMVDLLLKYEVMGINWSTLHRWEVSQQRPRSITEKAIRLAMQKARQQPSTVEAIRRR